MGSLSRCRRAVLALGMGAVSLSGTAVVEVGRVAAASVPVTNVIVQGGTTPTDSGLLQAVIEPGFAKAYPQYRLQYVSVGTGQAITNAKAGQADVVLTHSVTSEASFVASGYSYEPGGRLIMSSDFVTVGAKTDPAGVSTGTPNDVTAAFREIANAGQAGTADFVSRGDASGTNTKELAIWKQTGIALNTLGEPGTPGTTTTASWYHKTGDGQSANLQVTEQCPFTSGACYTVTDRGTFNAVVSQGVAADLKVVSQRNTGPGAIGGSDLLANPYHAYAVNPQKLPNVHINLPGALAFLNYLTAPKTQDAIGAYPNAANPAFVPDARPVITLTQGVPAAATAGDTLIVTGTLRPQYALDPPLAGEPVLLERKGDPGKTVANTTVGPDGTFTLSFTPTRSDSYVIYTPQYADGIVGSPSTSFRQDTTVTAGKLAVTATVTLSVDSQSGDAVAVSGTANPTADRIGAKVKIQAKRKGTTTFITLDSPIAMPNAQGSFGGTFSLPSAGTWALRAKYSDKGAVIAGVSAKSLVAAP